MTDMYRRRLLSALACSPLLSFLPSAMATTLDLTRIVSLEWLPTELLLALGVMPQAVADKHGYNIWVNQPPLPAQTIEVGLRAEPNMELLAQLKPLINAFSRGYGPAQGRLERIAPVMGFDFNRGDGQIIESARGSLHRLAVRLGREQQLKLHLESFGQAVESSRRRLAPYTRRPLLLMSLIDSRHVIVFSQNGLFQDMLNRLGFTNAWQGETTFWGSAVVGLERLAAIRDANVVCLEHDDHSQMEQLSGSALWQAMPFVREGRFRRAPAVWFYGATLSALLLCQVLESSLEADA